MSETKDRMLPKGASIQDFTLELHRIWNQEPKRFTHDQVVCVGGEYLKSKETGEWVSENNVENYETEMLNIQIEQYYEREQDKYC